MEDDDRTEDELFEEGDGNEDDEDNDDGIYEFDEEDLMDDDDDFEEDQFWIEAPHIRNDENLMPLDETDKKQRESFLVWSHFFKRKKDSFDMRKKKIAWKIENDF